MGFFDKIKQGLEKTRRQMSEAFAALTVDNEGVLRGARGGAHTRRRGRGHGRQGGERAQGRRLPEVAPRRRTGQERARGHPRRAPRRRQLRAAARHEALRHTHGRRERRRQDHDHRQARREIYRRGQKGPPRGGGHLPRRGGRAAERLGREGKVRHSQARRGLRPRRGRLRRAHRCEGARVRHSHHRHRRPPPQQGEPHERAREDTPHSLCASCPRPTSRRSWS